MQGPELTSSLGKLLNNPLYQNKEIKQKKKKKKNEKEKERETEREETRPRNQRTKHRKAIKATP